MVRVSPLQLSAGVRSQWGFASSRNHRCQVTVMRWVPPLALVSVTLLAACIPLPPGHSPSSRANVPQEIPDWLELRRTTLADVFFHLGAPDDLLAPDGRTL